MPKQHGTPKAKPKGLGNGKLKQKKVAAAKKSAAKAQKKQTVLGFPSGKNNENSDQKDAEARSVPCQGDVTESSSAQPSNVHLSNDDPKAGTSESGPSQPSQPSNLLLSENDKDEGTSPFAAHFGHLKPLLSVGFEDGGSQPAADNAAMEQGQGVGHYDTPHGDLPSQSTVDAAKSAVEGTIPHAVQTDESKSAALATALTSGHVKADGTEDDAREIKAKRQCLQSSHIATKEEVATPPSSRRISLGKSSPWASSKMERKNSDEVEIVNNFDMGHEDGFQFRKQILQRLFKWSWHCIHVLVKFLCHPGLNSPDSNRNQKHLKVVHNVTEMCSKYPAVNDGSCSSDTSDISAFPVSFNEEEMRCIHQIREDLLSCSISTCFSGLDSPATAYMQLLWGVQKALGCSPDDFPTAKNKFAVEIDQQAREECLNHPHEPEHVFGDMCDFFTPSVRDRLPAIIKNGQVQELLVPLVRSGNAAVDHAYCYKHGKQCKVSCLSSYDFSISLKNCLSSTITNTTQEIVLFLLLFCVANNSQVEAAEINCAGSPCIDYSPRGLVLRESGATFIAFLAWISQRLLLQEPILIHENVEGFGVSELKSYLGHLYEVITVLITPKVFGWGCSRTRRYTIMRHINKTAGWKMDFSVFLQLFKADQWFGEYDAQSDILPAWDCFFLCICCGST